MSLERPPLPAASAPRSRAASIVFAGGALIGTLGGLIGLGGAEFRLPLLIGLYRFRTRESVALNKAMSLVVVAAALPFRAASVPFGGQLLGMVPTAALLPALSAILIVSALKMWRHDRAKAP